MTLSPKCMRKDDGTSRIDGKKIRETDVLECQRQTAFPAGFASLVTEL